MSIAMPCSQRATAALIVMCACILFLVVSPWSALAQTETVIYSFLNPPDAFNPRCNLVVDTAGNMYGSTFSGGANNLGAVFKVTATGTESVLYSFTGGADGEHPIAGLVRDSKTGNLYGTTVYGGATNNGTVFMVTPSGSEKVLYSFTGGRDGANPYSSVTLSGANIFGTTINGGLYGYGTVFKLTAKGKETVLHDFNSAFPTQDGSYPYAGLVLYKGAFYGTTTLGGVYNLGAVFSITKSGAYSLIYSFQGGTADGQNPYSGVAFDTKGNLYGTTYDGGVDNAGTIFVIAKAGGESVIHHFLRNGVDGINPYASMILVKKNLYGTTLQGGSANGGTIFEITPSGVETVLHTFVGGADGFNPYGALVQGAANSFYTSTFQGGKSGLGTVIALVP